MLTFIIRRLILLVFVLWGVTIILFGILMTFSPERRAAAFITSPQQAKDIDKIIIKYGLDDPFYIQYFRWLKEVSQGNLGWSLVASSSVTEAFRRYLPTTLELILFAAPLIVLTGIWFGTLAGVHRDTWIDHTSRIVSIVGWSLPTFLLALVLLMIFYGYFQGMFPPGIVSNETRMYVIEPKYTLDNRFFDELSKERFRVTQQTVAEANNAGVPETILLDLKGLLGQTYDSEKKLLSALRKRMGQESLNQHKDLIVKHALQEGVPPELLSQLEPLKNQKYLTSLTITDRTLSQLREEETLPDTVLTQLEQLKGRDFVGFRKEKDFVSALADTLGHEQAETFKAVIIKYAGSSSEEKFLQALEGIIGAELLAQHKSPFLEYASKTAFTQYTGMYTIDGLLNAELSITLDALRHLILPIITEVIVIFALLVRVMRSGMIEALSQDYVITARAKGASKRIINQKHARRNAMIPVMTIAGVLIAGLMTGMITVEFVFNRQGLGWWLANSATQLDIPALLSVCLFVGFVFVIANLIVDILYAYLDPRIRLS